MIKHSNKSAGQKELREKLIGLGEKSFSKSYYPQLKQQIEKFKTIFNNTNEAIYIIKTNEDCTSARVVEFNDVACKMLGYDREEFSGLELNNINAMEKEYIATKLKEIIDKGTATFETSHLTKEGKAIPVEVSSNLFKLEDEEMILSIARDISERRKARENIKKAREEWKEIFQAVGHPVFILDPEFNILNVNQKAEEVTHIPKDKLIGQKCHEICHNSEHPPANCPFRKVLTSGKVETVEMEVEALNGYYLISATPIFNDNGDLEKIIHIATDITQQKKMKTQYRKLVNNAHDGIYIINPEMKFEFVNPAFEKITGYSAQELYNPDFNFRDIVLPEDIDKITDNKKNEQNKIEGRYDFRVLAKNDSIKNVEVRTVDIGKKDVRIMGIMRDISKRKQVEEDLRIQNLRYQNLIENELTGIGITDFNENLIFVNPTFADILGYSVEELEGMNLSELTTEKEYKKFLKENEKRKKNKESVYETKLIHKDGRLVDIIINASPHKDSDGKIIGTVGVIIDITEKKRAEKIALEREKWFKVLSDTISSAIFVFRDNKFVYVNRAAQKLTEYSGRELLNMNFWDPIHPDFQELIKNKFLKLKDKEQVSERIEFKIVTMNDQEKWVDFRSGRINWEEKPAIIGTAVDITDRKRIEQNLRESEEKFKMITNNTSSMVAILDSNGNYEYASPSHKSILGYTPQELMGQNAFEIITPEARSKLFELLKKGMSGEINRVSKMEYETYDKEGNLHYLEGSFDSIRDENDNLQKIINISDDITRRKKNEEERKKLEKQLQQAQKMESIGRLAGGVAHDLNNILTPILGYAELLQDSFSQSDERNNLVKQIIKSGDRAKNIVHQLLAFSRKQALEVKPINLNNVISRFKKLLRRTIKENIEINVNLAKPLPKIEADIGQIEQVIMNLSVNAQDAMPDGGKLTIATKLTQLDGAYSATHQNFQPGKYVCLSISDTGFGMDSETQSQIFEPFFSTKGDQGTGLGLATVYGIIKQHNGDINVYSEPGRGTTFKIYLPAIKKDIKKESQKKQRTITATGGAETILLVEDNPQVRNLAHQVLKNQGYHVLVKRDGKEALEIIRGHEEPIDLLLTDVVMPEMSGKELYTRALENYPDLKVLYMSGYTEDVIDHHGILNEGINFIQKPFSILKLATRVREILDQ